MRRLLFYVTHAYCIEILRPLQNAALARGDQVCWFLERPAAVLPLMRPHERILATVAEVKAYAPEAVFVPGNMVPDFFPGVKIGLFHGFSIGKRSEKRGHFRIRNCFDLYLTQGPATTEKFSDLARRLGHFAVVETGWPKLDPLFQDDVVEPAAHRPVVLFTSTFTPRLSAARELLPVIDRLARTRDWHWLLTLHPKMDAETVAEYRALERDNVSFYPPGNLVALYRRADVMVSDTSSTVPEFLLQGKAVVTLRNRQPGPHLIDIQHPEQLPAAIEQALRPPPELRQAIEDYARRIHPYRDGRSSQRVLAAVDAFIEGGGRQRLRRKPLNLIRKLKLRHRFAYYRWS